jgi:hypothetical protein
LVNYQIYRALRSASDTEITTHKKDLFEENEENSEDSIDVDNI